MIWPSSATPWHARSRTGASHRSGLEQRPLARRSRANLEGPLPWDRSRAAVSPFAYLERGRYVESLRPWIAAYGDRLRVLLLEDLLAGPATLADTYTWLGVDPGFRPPSAGTPVNASERARRLH